MTIFTIGARRTFGFANTIIWCVRHEIFLGVASSQEILYIPVHSSLIQTECICQVKFPKNWKGCLFISSTRQQQGNKTFVFFKKRIIFFFCSSTAGKPKGIISLSFRCMKKIITRVQNIRQRQATTPPAPLTLLKELRKLGGTGIGNTSTQVVLRRSHNAGSKGVKNTCVCQH